MRVLLAVLSCLALVVLVAVVAVCGVIGLAEAPVDAGVLLAAGAPDVAECSFLSATVVDAEHLTTDTACLRCPLDLKRKVAVLRVPYKNDGVNSASDTRKRNLGVRGPGVHAARG